MTLDQYVVGQTDGSIELKKVGRLHFLERRRLENLIFQYELRQNPTHPGVCRQWVGDIYAGPGVIQYVFMGEDKYLSEEDLAILRQRIAREGHYRLITDKQREPLETAILEYERTLKDQQISRKKQIGPIYRSDKPWGGLLYWTGNEFVGMPGEELALNIGSCKEGIISNQGGF
ncbi:hypothetical protein JW868_02170 [Candidatus Woesearchaeota archaeon]|nr:hypothetical protein [Candidatus Woesearchaeota archaeon]